MGEADNALSYLIGMRSKQQIQHLLYMQLAFQQGLFRDWDRTCKNRLFSGGWAGEHVQRNKWLP